MPTSLIATDRFIGIYPLKQFAHVIHENHRVRAASQWAPQHLAELFAVQEFWCGEKAGGVLKYLH